MEGNKLKIALVNQRYGLEVNGGSEYYTRELANHLKDRFEVEILTTKALGYETWENYYREDVEEIEGIVVRRFDVAKLRDTKGMKINEILMRKFPRFCSVWEKKWFDAQGPYAPALIHYIGEHKNDYAVIIFVTYLYYHAVKGIPAAADKAILLPTAHDEPYIYFHTFQKIFSMPAGFIYLTPEEKEFVESRFAVSDKPNCVTGAGVDVPDEVNPQAFKEKYKVDSDYIVYVGRIDPNKGCGEMITAFRKYKTRHPEDELKLVLMGKTVMNIPENDPNIIYAGFVSEQDKFDGIQGARALWLPSRFESLSISVLEALALGVPVIVNGNCEVLKGHCERSGAGIYYTDEDSAITCLETMQKWTDREDLQRKARKYIDENYQWGIIVDRIVDLIVSVSEKRK